MKISLNNNPETIDNIEEISVSELLKWKKFTFKMLVVKINGRLIKKDDYEHCLIREGDDVNILHLISGG
jgi:thiamine biosynthesis protein ThiS